MVVKYGKGGLTMAFEDILIMIGCFMLTLVTLSFPVLMTLSFCLSWAPLLQILFTLSTVAVIIGITAILYVSRDEYSKF